jgi:hypothetical protein
VNTLLVIASCIDRHVQSIYSFLLRIVTSPAGNACADRYSRGSTHTVAARPCDAWHTHQLKQAALHTTGICAHVNLKGMLPACLPAGVSCCISPVGSGQGTGQEGQGQEGEHSTNPMFTLDVYASPPLPTSKGLSHSQGCLHRTLLKDVLHHAKATPPS